MIQQRDDIRHSHLHNLRAPSRQRDLAANDGNLVPDPIDSSSLEAAATYRELAVPPHLQTYVTCLWQSSPGKQQRQTMILPDGCVDLIWQAGAEAFIAGPMTKPVAVKVPSGSAAVGIRFQPGVAAAVLGVSAADLRDIRVPFADAFRADRRVSPLDCAVPGTETPTITHALETLSGLLHRAVPPDPFIIGASKWFARNPGQPASAFVSGSGVSERHARRRFLDHVGYGPKTLQRILRMQRVLWLMSRPIPPTTLAQLAIAAGYADQAHLTREMRALTGQLPTALAGNHPHSAVADLFKTHAE